jgi:hypothetical protein
MVQISLVFSWSPGRTRPDGPFDLCVVSFPFVNNPDREVGIITKGDETTQLNTNEICTMTKLQICQSRVFKFVRNYNLKRDIFDLTT